MIQIFGLSLTGKRLHLLQSLIDAHNLKILYSEALTDEVELVVIRKKFQKYFSPKDVEQIIKLIKAAGDLIKVESKVELCRDPKDDFLVSLCKDGSANILVTNDNDLLVLKKFGQTNIVSLIEFLR